MKEMCVNKLWVWLEEMSVDEGDQFWIKGGKCGWKRSVQWVYIKSEREKL